MTQPGLKWYQHLNRYHWFVLTVAALGWLFDCLDQQLFILARPAAMKDLIPESAATNAANLNTLRTEAGDIATSVFILGWACGGLFFGMLGDRIGRAKTMMITILLYSLFTGLSSFSTSPWDFALYRFLTGLGVGGEFAVGVALVAETMPAAARPNALGFLQALSAVGNVSAAFINLGLGMAEEQGLPTSPWRIMFMIGAVPALLALVIRRKLKEPESWAKASHDDAVTKKLGSYSELFGDPKLRKHALLGLVLGCSGVIGLWSVGFYTMDLVRYVLTPEVTEKVYAQKMEEATKEGDSTRVDQLKSLQAIHNTPQKDALSSELKPVKSDVDKTISGRLAQYASYAAIGIQFGAFFGMYSFGGISQRIGRKPMFAISLITAFFSTLAVFYFLNGEPRTWILVPIMGVCQLSLFGGYAVYFPELFPTRLRSTGTSFCYNVGRFIAAFGPLVKAALTKAFEHSAEPLRYPGMCMCLVFLMGLLVLPFLPETRGKPLPE